MGICLGMQLLFERSLEYGDHKGLGLLRGSVIPMKGIIADELKVPHIGWNTLHVKREHPIFKYVKDGDYVYFVHSYFASECDDSLLSTTDYGVEMCAAVALDNVTGTQFHPEKSGDVGLGILKAFCEWEVE
jgi:glutamine amidotransferase